MYGNDTRMMWRHFFLLVKQILELSCLERPFRPNPPVPAPPLPRCVLASGDGEPSIMWRSQLFGEQLAWWGRAPCGFRLPPWNFLLAAQFLWINTQPLSSLCCRTSPSLHSCTGSSRRGYEVGPFRTSNKISNDITSWPTAFLRLKVNRKKGILYLKT